MSKLDDELAEMNLGIHNLLNELNVSEDIFKRELHSYRKNRVLDGGSLAPGIPSENTVRKWFSNHSLPSREGLGFILEFLHDQHRNARLRYSAAAIDQIKKGARRLNKTSSHVFENMLLEESRRKAYHGEKSLGIERRNVGLYALLRERSNGALVAEPFAILPKRDGDCGIQRESFWRVGGFLYCGDLLFGHKSIGGSYVIKSTDRPMNVLNLNICAGDFDSNGSLLAKVTATTTTTGDIYSKNSILVNISEHYNYLQQSEIDYETYFKKVGAELNDNLVIDRNVSEYIRSNQNELRRLEAEQLLNKLYGPLIETSNMVIRNSPKIYEDTKTLS